MLYRNAGWRRYLRAS